MILLPGGNRSFGLLNPGMDLTTYQNYIFVSPTYRGGVSEGNDEFGGRDVNDVKNLMAFLPTLQNLLDVQFQSCQVFMIGASRGGMEMFLALARYPELQQQVNKVVSLSGVLNFKGFIQDRPDIREMFVKKWKLKNEIKDPQWINSRNPLLSIPYLKTELPILIIQGGQDARVSLSEGLQMVEKLEQHGNPVTYWNV